MKKFATALLTLTLALICAFGFAACEDGNTMNGNGNESTTSTNEVTAEEWKNIFESVDNYTMTSPDDEMLVAKFDGDKYYSAYRYKDEYGQNEDRQDILIFVKEGDEYFQYLFFGSEWEKWGLFESMYYNSINSSKESFSMFKDNYNAFTYSDGKYTCALLDRTMYDEFYTIQNVEVKFEDGRLISMLFDIVVEGESIKYDVKDIGTTIIELPTEYVDHNGSYFV